MLLTLSLLFTIGSNVVLFLLVGFYFFKLRERERSLMKKEHATDENYHHVIDDAVSKERKILEDATHEADEIISGAKYISTNSQTEVDQAIQTVVMDVHKEAGKITSAFTSEYTGSLKQLTMQSLNEFHTVMTGMQTGLQKQIADFHQSLLPEIHKELESYKQQKMKSIDQTVMTIIQKASQEIFNKSLSVGDHQSIVTDALEKAKKEGVFD